MKNLFFFLFFCLIFLCISACHWANNNENVRVESQSLYLVHVHQGGITVAPVLTESIKDFSEAKIQPRSGNNPSTNGFFNLGALMCTFSAIENNSGVHGNTHLTGDGFFQDVRFNSDCITVIDNAAFWGGEITKWIVADPDLLPYDVGWIMVPAVRDNRQGNNDPPDEVGSTFVVAPPESLPSDFNLPFDTWCDFANAVYNGEEGSPFYVPGADPTNIMVK